MLNLQSSLKFISALQKIISKFNKHSIFIPQFFTFNKKMTQTEKLVLIDTDCGIDDAWGILMALAAHQDKSTPIRLVGITCTHGNTSIDYVIRNVALTLQAAGVENIPIFRGCESSMVLPYKEEPPYHGVDGFGDVDWHSIDPIVQEEHAVNAIIRLAEEYKGQLTIVALGPLTNLAMATRLKPNLKNLVKEVFILGGNHQGLGNTTVLAEYNALCDAEAFHVVLHNLANPCEVVIVPWETCIKTASKYEFRIDVIGQMDTAQVKLLNKAEADILEKTKSYWLPADALAVAVGINSLVSVKSARFHSTVELGGHHARGMLVVHKNKYLPSKQENCTIIQQFDQTLYEKMLIWAAGGAHYGQASKDVVMLSQ